MRIDVTLERVARIEAACRSIDADRTVLTSALDDVARLESWAKALQAELVQALDARPGSFAEADIAETSGCSLSAASKDADRARTLDQADSFADALDAGDIRPTAPPRRR